MSGVFLVVRNFLFRVYRAESAFLLPFLAFWFFWLIALARVERFVEKFGGNPP
jgi:hypothetical protein